MYFVYGIKIVSHLNLIRACEEGCELLGIVVSLSLCVLGVLWKSNLKYVPVIADEMNFQSLFNEIL